jgi:hypothetical protein
MHKLVDLERNESACDGEFALEFAHDTLQALLGIIDLDIWLRAVDSHAALGSALRLDLTRRVSKLDKLMSVLL